MKKHTLYIQLLSFLFSFGPFTNATMVTSLSNNDLPELEKCLHKRDILPIINKLTREEKVCLSQDINELIKKFEDDRGLNLVVLAINHVSCICYYTQGGHSIEAMKKRISKRVLNLASLELWCRGYDDTDLEDILISLSKSTLKSENKAINKNCPKISICTLAFAMLQEMQGW